MMYAVVMLKEKNDDHWDIYFHCVSCSELSVDDLKKWGILRIYPTPLRN